MKRRTTLLTSLLLAVLLPWEAQATEPAVGDVLEIKSDTSTVREVSVDAVVEAVRQATLSTQVPGAVVSLSVKAGDKVRAGQELARIDARVAQQQVAGSTAQMEAAQAQLKVATRELERQQQLFQKQYISQGALERAQAQWEAAQAQVQALQAQTQGGIVSLMVCDYKNGELRGYVRYDKARLDELGPAPTLHALFGDGYLAITFDLATTGQRYQGVVPLEGETLAQAWGPLYGHCVEAFGPNRCMFESNFPPDRDSVDYPVIWNTFKRIAARYSASEKHEL